MSRRATHARILPIAPPRSGVVVLVALVAGACAEDDADRGAQLLLPDDVQIHWDDSFNGEADGLGALVPVDVMVYEGASGEPLDGALVVLEASDVATWVLLDEDFLVVEPESCPSCALLWDARRDQYLVLEETGEEEGEPAIEGSAAVDLDGELEQGGALDPERAPEQGRPSDEGGFWAAETPDDLHHLALETDPDGLARAYLFVDAFPVDELGADLAAVSVVVSLGTAEASFDLIPR